MRQEKRNLQGRVDKTKTRMTAEEYLDATPAPSEAVEQTRLFQWAAGCYGTWPDLELMHHIPNGGSRHPAEAAKLKAQGVKAGVPDIFLPVPRCGCHGLYIELKREKGGRVSHEQAKWMEMLIQQGYMAAVCHGWFQASQVIERYMKGDAENGK